MCSSTCSVGQDGGAGRDPPEQRHHGAVDLRLGQRHRPGLGRVLRQQALALEVGELRVDARGRGQTDRLADLADRGRVAAGADGLRDDVEDPLLPGSDVRHGH